MVKFEVIVIHVAVFQFSQLLVSGDDQCCGGVIKLSNNASTCQQPGLCQIGYAPEWTETGNLLLCTLLQGCNADLVLSNKKEGRCGADDKQLQVEVCVNDTWEIALCNTSTCDYHNCLCTPGNLSISQNPNNVTLNWSQPLHNYSILCCPAPYYNKNCSVKHYCHENSSLFATIMELKPHTDYKFCLLVNGGQSLCQYVRTLPAAPGPPTDLNAINVTENICLLTWKPPEEKNGVIQSYYIEIEMVNGHGQEEIWNVTTKGDDLFLLVPMDQLTEGLEYTFKVAANTTEMGDYANGTLIKVPSSQGEMVPLSQGDLLIMLLSFAIGFVILILIVETIVAATVCNRMRKQNKSLTREIQEYEMTSKYSAVRHDTGSLPDRYLAIKKRDSNRKQPLYPPAHLATDYLTPTMTRTTGPIEEKKTEEKVKTDECKDTHSEDKEKTKTNETCDKNSEENPYQSLIVSRTDSTTPTPDGYIKITRSRVGTLEEGTSPPKSPPVPPNPEPDYSLKSLIPHLSLASDLPPKSENMYASKSETS